MSRADEIRAKRQRMAERQAGRADTSEQSAATEQGSARATERESTGAEEQASRRAGEQTARTTSGRAPIFPGRTRRRPAVRVDDVKFSVLLSPRAHAGLVSWCAEAATVLGRTRVPTTDAVKALVALLVEEESLGDAVLDELEKMDRAKMRRGSDQG